MSKYLLVSPCKDHSDDGTHCVTLASEEWEGLARDVFAICSDLIPKGKSRKSSKTDALLQLKSL